MKSANKMAALEASIYLVSFPATSPKVADTLKDGLETICIFPGFDYATAHDGHM